jgi:hypothetical protein
MYDSVQVVNTMPWRVFPLVRRSPVSWLVLSLALVGSFLAGQLLRNIGTSATPSLNVIDQALASSSTTNLIDTTEVGHEVSQIRSACGYALAIKKVYADPQQVVVAYVVTWPATAVLPTLVTGTAGQRPALEGSPGDRFSFAGYFVSPVHNNSQGQVLTFAVTTLKQHPAAVLPLTVTIPLRWSTTNGERRSSTSCGPSSGTGGTAPEMGGAATFAFNFDAPLTAMRTLSPNQVVRVGHVQVTIRRVEMTPINTRVYVAFRDEHDVASLPAEIVVPNQLRSKTTQEFLVSHDGKTWYPGRGPIKRQSDLWSYDFAAPFYGFRGIATFQVYTNARVDNPLDGDLEYEDPADFALDMR